MSEYQYYEFRAVERPRSPSDKQALRAISSRATISSRAFRNFYTFGNFKGDSLEFMKQWFDLHLYFTNWGTRIVMMRIPRGTIPQETFDRFLTAVDEVRVTHTPDHLILAMQIEDESGRDDDWMLDAEDLLPIISSRHCGRA